MNKIIITAFVFILIAAGLYLFIQQKQPTQPSEITNNENILGAPTFTWVYRTIEDDEIPETEISLTAAFENGKSETKPVDSVEGSCNTFEDADDDIYKNSTMIICYYAGLGRYFKVVEVDGGYAVQRKIFEEASPDYTPPQNQFETIVRF